MLRFFDYTLSGFLMSGLVVYMLSKLSGNKINFKSWKTYFMFIVLAIVELINYHFVNGYIKIVIIWIFIMVVNYMYFQKNIKKSIINSLMIELVMIFSELIFTFLIIFFSSLNFSNIANKYFGTGTLLINIIMTIISVNLINFSFVTKLYNNIIIWTEKLNDKSLVILMMLVMITANTVYSTMYYKLDVRNLLIINIVLQIIYVYIVIKILNEKDRYIRISSKYNVTISSLRELRDVVSILKIKSHENQNQLKTIRDMIKKKDKKVIKYIDTLLGDKLEEDEKLRIETSLISNSEINSLIYSKMITMKEKGINATLHVDKALQKINLYELDDIMTLYICKIIGVWLDNAIEAVSNLDNKKIEIHMFLDLDNNFIITISNNFCGKIILESINDDGYTTKGKGHGYGLSLVRDIINKNSKFVISTTLKDNIFVQNLKIKM